MTSTELISVSMDIGQKLLESGAEIYRVEESISRICRAYGAKDVNVYAVPTAIVASMVREGEKPITRVSRIYHRSTNLGRLDQLNTLCREICCSPMDHVEICERLHLIDRHKMYRNWQLCLATGGVGCFFTLLFGGGWEEACCAFFTCLILWVLTAAAGRIHTNTLFIATGGVGCFFTLLFGGGWEEACCAFFTCLILWVLTAAAGRIHTNTLFINLVGGFWVALSGLLCLRAGFIEQYDTMIIGSIMFLVPGLPITNAIRDLIAGDVVAGITKFTEALLVAAGIAVGAALPLGIAGLLGR